MRLSSQIILAFAVVILTSAIDSVANYWLSLKVKENIDYLNRSQVVIHSSSDLQKELIVIESAFRGFLLTGDSAFLFAFNEGLTDFELRFNHLKQVCVGSERKTARLNSLDTVYNKWVHHSRLAIQARQAPGSSTFPGTYRRLFISKAGGEEIDNEILEKFDDFDKSEYDARERHSNELLALVTRTHGISFIFLGLTIIIGISSATYIVRLISKRIERMVHLARQISEGNFSVVQDTANDELTALSKSLNLMSNRLSRNILELQHHNDELNKFAYVVSHDLKAPIRGITNVVQWIEEDLPMQLSPQLREYLHIINQRTSRMEDLINGLLDYARMGEKASAEHIDTYAMVKEIVDAIVPRHFEVKLHRLPMVFSERLKLEQVFTNLISNAVKYTTRPDAAIEISSSDLGDYYRFSVKDNGIGIAPAYHEKIFEIFQTLREKHEKESTGIGLAIVKKIVTEQHGVIKVNSAPGQGAEFIFTWPKKSKA